MTLRSLGKPKMVQCKICGRTHQKEGPCFINPGRLTEWIKEGMKIKDEKEKK